MGEGFYLALPADGALKARVDALARGESEERPGSASPSPRHTSRVGCAARSAFPSATASWSAAWSPGRPADAAGIAEGDLLVAAGGRTVDDVDALHEALRDAGLPLELTLVRGAEERTVTVKRPPRATTPRRAGRRSSTRTSREPGSSPGSFGDRRPVASGGMPRLPLPKVLADVFDDRQARTTLLAGTVALLAAGLDPKVWGPSLSTVQAAIRERPSLEAYVIVGAVASAILLLVGGAIGDLRRVRPLIVGGLATFVVTGSLGLLFASGPVFIAARVVGAAAAALTIPAALASVALAYHGVARATAIGIAYAAYAGSSAVMPILLTVIPGAQWPGFVRRTDRGDRRPDCRARPHP